MNPSPGRSLRLDTYDGQAVPNSIDADPSAEMVALAMKFGLKGYMPGPWIIGPTGRYNCHGLTFASRRTNIPPAGDPNSLQVKDLLARDRYSLRVGTPRPGDIVSYTSAHGEIIHTGVVVRIDVLGDSRQIIVLSKWGGLGECEHHVNACPDAPDSKIEYWTLNS